MIKLMTSKTLKQRSLLRKSVVHRRRAVVQLEVHLCFFSHWHLMVQGAALEKLSHVWDNPRTDLSIRFVLKNRHSMKECFSKQQTLLKSTKKRDQGHATCHPIHRMFFFASGYSLQGVYHTLRKTTGWNLKMVPLEKGKWIYTPEN